METERPTNTTTTESHRQHHHRPVSVSEWIKIFIILIIPIYGLIMDLKWSKSKKMTSRKTFAQAALIIRMAADTVLVVYGVMSLIDLFFFD